MSELKPNRLTQEVIEADRRKKNTGKALTSK